jgi:molybdopterin/thiamine biosynthesis adenylyltransferase
MRNATILVVRLRGVATEAIKNMVLAGIGRLILMDGDEVLEEDLGAGFFFRDEDVGKNVRSSHAPLVPEYVMVISRQTRSRGWMLLRPESNL